MAMEYSVKVKVDASESLATLENDIKTALAKQRIGLDIKTSSVGSDAQEKVFNELAESIAGFIQASAIASKAVSSSIDGMKTVLDDIKTEISNIQFPDNGNAEVKSSIESFLAEFKRFRDANRKTPITGAIHEESYNIISAINELKAREELLSMGLNVLLKNIEQSNDSISSSMQGLYSELSRINDNIVITGKNQTQINAIDKLKAQTDKIIAQKEKDMAKKESANANALTALHKIKAEIDLTNSKNQTQINAIDKLKAQTDKIIAQKEKDMAKKESVNANALTALHKIKAEIDLTNKKIELVNTRFDREKEKRRDIASEKSKQKRQKVEIIDADRIISTLQNISKDIPDSIRNTEIIDADKINRMLEKAKPKETARAESKILDVDKLNNTKMMDYMGSTFKTLEKILPESVSKGIGVIGESLGGAGALGGAELVGTIGAMLPLLGAILVAVALIVSIVSVISGVVQQALSNKFSGYMKAMQTLLDTFVNLIFKPVADVLGMLLVPFLKIMIVSLLPFIKGFSQMIRGFVDSQGGIGEIDTINLFVDYLIGFLQAEFEWMFTEGLQLLYDGIKTAFGATDFTSLLVNLTDAVAQVVAGIIDYLIANSIRIIAVSLALLGVALVAVGAVATGIMKGVIWGITRGLRDLFFNLMEDMGTVIGWGLNLLYSVLQKILPDFAEKFKTGINTFLGVLGELIIAFSDKSFELMQGLDKLTFGLLGKLYEGTTGQTMKEGSTLATDAMLKTIENMKIDWTVTGNEELDKQIEDAKNKELELNTTRATGISSSISGTDSLFNEFDSGINNTISNINSAFNNVDTSGISKNLQYAYDSYEEAKKAQSGRGSYEIKWNEDLGKYVDDRFNEEAISAVSSIANVYNNAYEESSALITNGINTYIDNLEQNTDAILDAISVMIESITTTAKDTVTDILETAGVAKEDIKSAVESVESYAKSAKEAIKKYKDSVKGSNSKDSALGSRADGGVIPTDGMYNLHAGEFVMNRGNTKEYFKDSKSSGGTININVKIDATGATPDSKALAEEVKKHLNNELKKRGVK